jgi:hypothetical protein
MSNLLNYVSFSSHISESRVNEGFVSLGDPNWPSNWKDMPEWKKLQDLGFSDVTTPRMASNQTILLKNFTSDLGYKEGIVLQKSGYIRDKSVSSGFIKRYVDYTTGKPANLKDILDYLIGRWGKAAQRDVRTPNHGPLTDTQIKAVNRVTKGKWKYNKTTGKVDVSSSVEINSDKDIKDLSGVQFGEVSGNFYIIEKIKNLDLAPRYVGKDFQIRYGDFLKDLTGCPDVIGGSFSLTGSRIPTDITGMTSPGNVENVYMRSNERLRDGLFLHFTQPGIPWTMEGITKALSEFSKMKYSPADAIGNDESLVSLLTYLEGAGSGSYLYKYFEQNPLDIYLLDSLPDLKEKVLKKLGIKDVGRIGKMLRGGLY